jgi:polysaccharide biosynthesis protein VpsJ
VTGSIDAAVARIRAWGEARDWRGYDPYDALNSPAAALLTLGRPLGRRLLTQAVKRSPLNLRPLLGIKPGANSKAIALVASGYARLAAAGDDSARDEAVRRLEWLAARGPGWGYHFPVQTRFFAYAAESPNTIATSFAAHALLDGCELLDLDSLAVEVESACDFLTAEMLPESAEGTFFRYVPGENELVHNGNLLACSVLVRAARVLDRSPLLERARPAVMTSLAAQRDDGSWPYAESARGRWVDNFHTAYVLESLALCARSIPAARDALDRGVDYWERELFLSDGTPKYAPDRVLPLDAHCYASAIDAYLALAPWRASALARAERTAALLVTRMLDPSGYVYFQRERFWMNRVPFVRWTTAPSFKALAGLVLARVSSAASTREGQAGARLD